MVNAGGTINCVWTLVHLHHTLQFYTFQGNQGNHQSLQWNVCAAHVNNVSSTLVKSADFSEFLSGATVGWFVREFFRINNIELKCPSSGSENGAADVHISVDLLRSTTAAELLNSVDLLCGTTDAELNNPVWCMHQESHTFSEDSDEPCWKICWIKPKYNFTQGIKRFGRFSKHRSIVDFQQTVEMCIYENAPNF